MSNNTHIGFNKNYRTNFYNLDAIISVGYRVRSAVATRFGIWATQQLREFIVKGFVLDDEFGDQLVNDFAAIATALEKRLAEWGNDDEEEEESEDGEAKQKGLPEKKKKKLLDTDTWKRDARLVETTLALRQELGGDVFEDYNLFRDRVDDALKKLGFKLSAFDLKTLLRAVSWRVETAPPVIAKFHRPGKGGRATAIQAGPLRGFFPLAPTGPGRGEGAKGKEVIVEYEPDPDLRDTEQVPLLEPGGIEAFIRREVLPYTPDAWIKEEATKIGYESSFTRHFYQPQPLRTLDEIRADILAVEKEAEGLLDELLKQGAK